MDVSDPSSGFLDALWIVFQAVTNMR